MNLTYRTIVRDIAAGSPNAARVLEAFGIDYCCGGALPLDEACRQKDLATETVLEALRQPNVADGPEDRWNTAPLTELTDFIVQRHHGFVRKESARLTELLNKVQSRHGANHPEVNSVAETFEALASELSAHMMKEEQVLFPMIGRLEQAALSEGPSAAAAFSTVEFPIQRMVAEHEDAGELLGTIRSLTGSFQPPADACPTFRALYQGLEEFERDLHQHIHLENNILFPRAIALTRVSVESASAIR